MRKKARAEGGGGGKKPNRGVGEEEERSPPLGHTVPNARDPSEHVY